LKIDSRRGNEKRTGDTKEGNAKGTLKKRGRQFLHNDENIIEKKESETTFSQLKKKYGDSLTGRSKE